MTEPRSPSTGRSAARSWSRGRRWAFRFAALYFLLYTFPFPAPQLAAPFTLIPGVGRPFEWASGALSQAVDGAWKAVAVRAGASIFGIEGEIFTGPTGSGDTTVDYLKLFLMLVIAGLGSVVWTVLADVAERRSEVAASSGKGGVWIRLWCGLERHVSLPTLFTVACRYYLGFFMLVYGFAKVINIQFGEPSLTKLLQPVGDLSPMGMVWTFMGTSAPYTAFAGAAEVLGGLLVMFRRTRALGAMVVIGVMANVTVLNFAYDVPVKLFSSHLLLMAVYLLALDGRRVANLLVLNRPVPAADLRPYSSVPWLRRFLIGAKWTLIASAVTLNLKTGWMNYQTFGAGRPKSPLWGIHDVTRFLSNGEELPPLLTDPFRFSALIVDRPEPIFGNPGNVALRLMDGSFEYTPVEIDLDGQTLELRGPQPSGAPIARLSYERPTATTMVLRGRYREQEVEIYLEERELSQLLLVGRGFHWINEYPFNR